MRLSIVVLSYNRPSGISRIIRSLEGFKGGGVEVIVKDDCSPRGSEIESLVKASILYEYGVLKFLSNDKNLGYDLNLLSSFDVASGDYVLLLSDDDYLDGDRLNLLVSFIESLKSALDVVFLPYIDGKHTYRVAPKNYAFSEFAHIVYNSILFSGLIFRRDAVLNLAMDKNFLSHCIYSQVYLACSLIYKQRSLRVFEPGFLYLGGDGENFFGKNENSKSVDLLADRKRESANFRYQGFLVRTVWRLALDHDVRIFLLFSIEYLKRSVGYVLKIRSCGMRSFLLFTREALSSKNPMVFPLLPIFLLLIALPSRVSASVFSFFRTRFRKSG